jgi:hypothetical protein
MQTKAENITFFSIHKNIKNYYIFIYLPKNYFFLNETENILIFFKEIRLFCSSKFKKYVITISGN